MRVWIAIVAAALAAGAQQQRTNFYSLDKELAMGRQLAGELSAKTTPLNSPAASAYVNHVVDELGPRIPDSKFPYVVTIVKDDLGAEPDVLAGGQIFLSAGLFRAAQNESEFVGLLARSRRSSIPSRDREGALSNV